jgi:hypothetical protein
MAEDFFGKFSELVAGQAAAALVAAPESEPAPETVAAPVIPVEEISVAEVPVTGAPSAPEPVPDGDGLSPLVWVAGLVVIVGAILWYFTR